MHNVLERPRDRPWRTAIGAAFLSWVMVIFVFGAADRIYVLLGISYQGQLWASAGWPLAAGVVLFATHRICVNLKQVEEHDEEEELAEEEARAAARAEVLAGSTSGEAPS